MSRKETDQDKQSTQKSKAARFTEDNMFVGDRVRELRESVDWTPADLCRKVGMSSAHLSRLERGERGISSRKFVDVEDAVEQEKANRRPQVQCGDERSRATFHKVRDMVYDALVHDGISSARAERICELIIHLIESAYTP